MDSRERKNIRSVWREMLNRCRKKDHPDYSGYGARGIYVCDEWSCYETFLSDMGQRPQGQSIERVDNDGPYSKANCRWATPKEQAQNRRVPGSISFNGEFITYRELSKRTRVHADVLRTRINSGLSTEEAISKPIRHTPRFTAVIDGVSFASMREISIHYGIPYDTLLKRTKSGWDIQKIVSTPNRVCRRAA